MIHHWLLMHNIQICKDNHYAYTYMNNMQEFATLHKSIGETQEEEMLNKQFSHGSHGFVKLYYVFFKEKLIMCLSLNFVW